MDWRGGMFQWNDTRIAYMDRAARHTQYYQMIAAHIGKQLIDRDCVCDVGCGLGYLSLALAQYAGQVEAIDTCEAALDILRANCTDKENIKPVHADMLRKIFFVHVPNTLLTWHFLLGDKLPTYHNEYSLNNPLRLLLLLHHFDFYRDDTA